MTTPVVVLTGFLGSGKTTLLQKALASPDLADTAVIINEAGEMGLDHLLVEAVDEQVLELPSGCLCCVRRLDIVTTLRMLIDRRDRGEIRAFRRVVIETSGLADTAPVLFTLAADAMLGQAVTLQAVVTLVDCVHGAATIGRHPEAAAQLAVADRIILSKTDLRAPDAALLAQLAALNGWAERLGSSAGADPATLLFAAAPRLREPMPAPVEVAHTHGLATCSVVLQRPPSRFAFARMLGRFASDRGEDLLRAKGLLAFSDRPDRVAVIHAVQHTISAPHWLAAWPDADTRSRLVFITRDIAPAEIFERFAECDPVRWTARRTMVAA